MRGLLLAALLGLFQAPAMAEDGKNLGCFSGLNDSSTPAALPDCESPDLLNVESDLNGTAILKRKGFSKFADLSVSTWPVNGSHSFIDSSGNRLDIVCQDTNCAKSTNGNAFALFLTTAAAGITRWSFVDQGGILYGANNRRDPIMAYDGTTRRSPATMPAGSILELTQDRLAIGDISGQPNRVHRSSAGAYEMFTLGVNPEDSFFDDYGAAGDRIRGMKCIGGNCFYFKTASITLCEEANQYNTRCSVISPNIGTTDPASIVAAGSSLYFRAQDKNYWEITPSGLRQISKKIPNLVKSQSGGLAGGENTNTQTTKADWDAGVQSPLSSWNTAFVNGSIVPSSVTLADTTQVDFTSGTLTNVSLTDLAGSVKLSSSVYEDTWAVSAGTNTTDGRLAWVNAPPDDTNGKFKWGGAVGLNPATAPGINTENPTYDCRFDFGGQCVIQSSSFTLANGSWKFTHAFQDESGSTMKCAQSVADTQCFEFRFMKNLGGDYYSATLATTGNDETNKYVRITKTVAGTVTKLTQATYAYGLHQTFHEWEVVRTPLGVMYLYIDGVQIASTTADVAISSSVMVQIAAHAQAGAPYQWNIFKNVRAYNYSATGSITSRIFDSATLTPTWGPLASTFTAYNAVGEGNIAFYTQVSTASDGGGFDAAVSSSDTLRVTSGLKRYVRYRADFSTQVSTKSPNLDSIAIQAVTTGTFRTACIQPNSAITSWGTLNCAQTLAGNGSEVFYATSAATCAALPSGAPNTWQTTQTNNATVTIATNTAVYIGWRSLLGSTTDQAQVDSCVLAWNEGTPAQPAWAVYDSIKNAVYWTTTINNGAYSNRILKYDRNLESWFPMSLQAQAPRVINNDLYFGSASSGTWNKYGGVDSDNGLPINGFYTTKDFGSDSPFLEKDFQTASVLTRNNGSGSLTGTWTNSIGATGTWDISLSTGTGIVYQRSLYKLPKKSPQQFMSLRFGNNSSTPFEILGLSLKWTVLPWIVR